jgi:hypothetical protein
VTKSGLRSYLDDLRAASRTDRLQSVRRSKDKELILLGLDISSLYSNYLGPSYKASLSL